MGAAICRCHCDAFLCEVCIPTHHCFDTEVAAIGTDFVNGSQSHAVPLLVPCAYQCRQTLRIVSWNINHFAKFTKGKTAEDTRRKTEKYQAKLKAIGFMAADSDVDAIALQEVNPSGIRPLSGELDAWGMKLYPGPRLCTQSWQSRQQFTTSIVTGAKAQATASPPTDKQLAAWAANKADAKAMFAALRTQVENPSGKKGRKLKDEAKRRDLASKAILRMIAWCKSDDLSKTPKCLSGENIDAFKEEFLKAAESFNPLASVVNSRLDSLDLRKRLGIYHPPGMLDGVVSDLTGLAASINREAAANQLANWCAAVRNGSAEVARKKGMGKEVLRAKILADLKEAFPEAEKFYFVTRELKEAYQEHYPLLVKPDVVVENITLYWGNNDFPTTLPARDSSVKEDQPIYFRGPGTEDTLETTQAEAEAENGNEAEDEDGPDSQPRNTAETNEEGNPDGEKEETAVSIEELPQPGEPSRFRPVVVYKLRRKCDRPDGCDMCPAQLGVVHTSPAGKEFRRDIIFQQQLKKVFEQAKASGYWCFAGDFYLSPEALVSLQGDMPLNANRNFGNMSFERQIADSFTVVTSVSGTQTGPWKPRHHHPLDPANVQIADFAVCSKDWAMTRTLSVETRSGRPIVIDENHQALQLMMQDDSSDHLPVYVFLSRFDASEMLAKTLQYDEGAKEAVGIENQFYAEQKRQFFEEFQKSNGESGTLEVNEGNGPAFVQQAKELKRKRQRRLSTGLPRTFNPQVLDFNPDFDPCRQGEKRERDKPEQGTGKEKESDLGERSTKQQKLRQECRQCSSEAVCRAYCDCGPANLCGLCASSPCRTCEQEFLLEF
jgi:hypothetical protein